MIRNAFLILCFNTILFNCQSVQCIYEDKDYVLTPLEQQFDFKDKTVSVFFENGFIENCVEIYFDGNLSYNKKINTDYTIGVAGFLLYDKKFENVSILIDEKKMNFTKSDLKGFRNIYVNKKGHNDFIVTFSNRPHLYR